MAVETDVLKSLGFLDLAIQTILKARKPQSAKVFHPTWEAYFGLCEKCSFHPLRCSTLRVLAFLQSGLEQGLGQCSLKGQILAWSILFQCTLAFGPRVKTFLQGVAHCVSPFHHLVKPWNLVLEALQTPAFDLLREIPLCFLSWKVAFIVAITSISMVYELATLSCKSPFLIVPKDKVVPFSPEGGFRFSYQ